MTVGLTYVPDVQFFPFYVAQEQGFFDDAGLDITIRHHGSQEGLFTALTTNREDVVYAGADELMVARDEGVEAVSFATMYQEYPLALIVPAESDIETVADMNGNKLGIPGEFGSNYYATLALQEEYDLEDMNVMSIGFTQMAALTRGDVDGVIGFSNNDAVAMENQGFPVRTISLDDLPLVSVGLISTPASIEDNEDEYAAMVDALDRAVEFAQDNPQEALDNVAVHVPTLTDDNRDDALSVMEATIPLYTGGAGFGRQDPQKWEAMSSFMVDAGLITDPHGAPYVDITQD